MISHGLEVSTSVNLTTNNDEYDNPIDISDILYICREYNKLGWQIQDQVANIIEAGVDESIKSGMIQRAALPHIRNFLEQIVRNAYFGDATKQAEECINLIKNFQDKHILSLSNFN
jgi:hypothetical protein